MSRFDAMYPKCGPDCNCGMLCKRASAIDEHFAGSLAFMLECAILDPHGYFDAACALLDEYKAEREKINPSPPTFMGEPMPPERRERFLAMRRARETAQNPHGNHAEITQGEPDALCPHRIG
ncbi:hypothetical protein [Ralstonia mannitolilytica]|uniref:hypothetical protein n=1 Tax=Ralstonia mannitolilytica TaxID=105219 RepID=UPI0026EB8067|nr:hypothetical protein [Ralstonia mannitolilytica]